MKKEPKIIIEFTKLARPLFESDKEWENFLYTPDHFWSAGSHTTDLSPYQFLVKSRRVDKLEYAVNFIKQMKETIIAPSKTDSLDTLSQALLPIWKKQEPDYILEGNKWWIDKETCRYIQSKANLKNKKIYAFFVQVKGEDSMSRVVVEDNAVIHETSSLETQATFIDMLNIAN